MNENYYEDEIDLKDLLLFVLKKWRVILIGLLVGIILGAIFSLVKMNEGTPAAALRELNKLGSSDINVNNIRTYANYKRLYEESLEYEDNSILFNLDANNVFTAYLSYSFTSSAKDEDTIKEYYLGFLSRDNNLNRIKERSSKDYSLNNIKDLISINSTDEVSLSNNTSIFISNKSEYGFGKIIISIMDKDEEFVRNAKETIEDIITENDRILRNRYTDYFLTKINDNVVFGYNSDLLQRKMDRINERQDLFNALTNIESKLKDNDKLYYSYYYDYDNVFANVKPHFSLKWPVIIGFVSAVAVCGFYFVLYLFNSKVKNEDELRNRFSMPLLGVVKEDKIEYKGIDKILNNFEKYEYVDYTYLSDLLKSLDKKILICNEEEKFNEVLKKMDKKIKVCGYLDNDSKALDALKERDGIVIISKNGDTDINRIERQFELAKKLNKEVIGFISVR